MHGCDGSETNAGDRQSIVHSHAIGETAGGGAYGYGVDNQRHVLFPLFLGTGLHVVRYDRGALVGAFHVHV